MEVEDGSRFLLVVWGVRASEDCNVVARRARCWGGGGVNYKNVCPKQVDWKGDA